MMSDKKQTRKFRLRYMVFFTKDKEENLRQLVQKTSDEEIMESDGGNLRIANHKIDHKNACIHHEKNGEP